MINLSCFVPHTILKSLFFHSPSLATLFTIAPSYSPQHRLLQPINCPYHHSPPCHTWDVHMSFYDFPHKSHLAHVSPPSRFHTLDRYLQTSALHAFGTGSARLSLSAPFCSFLPSFLPLKHKAIFPPLPNPSLPRLQNQVLLPDLPIDKTNGASRTEQNPPLKAERKGTGTANRCLQKSMALRRKRVE